MTNRERLEYLNNVSLKEIEERIKAARALGNLSDNPDYDAAKIDQLNTLKEFEALL